MRAGQGEWKRNIGLVHADCLPVRGGDIREVDGVREFYTQGGGKP